MHNELTMSNLNSNDRFIRWQTNLRNQVSFTNNLILTISIAICGFIFNLLIKESFIIASDIKSKFRYGIILLIVSIFFGIITNISRTIDYKLTLKKIKKELEAKSNLDEIKFWKNTFGNITWFLFFSQVITLLISVICLGLSFYEIFKVKLN